MNIVCVICSELLTPSDDVFHTSCGHIFHYVCLLQWLERGKTCPQCRAVTTNRTIHRIYFNFSNNDSIAEDSASLQNKLDNLNFQLKLERKNNSNLTEDKEKLKNETAGLRQKVTEVESEINSKNSAIYAYKEQIKFFKQQCSNAENDRKEKEKLKEKIDLLKNVQNLIDDSSKSNVEDITMQVNDASKLRLYIGILKNELENMREKNKALRNKHKNEQQKFMQVSKKIKFLEQECAKQTESIQRFTEETKSLKKQLEDYGTEKMSLQIQLLNMETNAQKCCNKIFVEQESQEQENLKTHKESCTVKSNEAKIESIAKLEKSNSCIINPVITENISQNKSQDFCSMQNHGMKRQKSNNNLKIPSTLVKKSRINPLNQVNFALNQETISCRGMGFDGFGGHAKYDKFPDPIFKLLVKTEKQSKKLLKVSKPKLDTGNNQKISDFVLT